MPDGMRLLVMLEYTDNAEWVESELHDAVSLLAADAEILTRPLSLTAGVHTGPGTWGIAFLTLPHEPNLSGSDTFFKTATKMQGGET